MWMVLGIIALVLLVLSFFRERNSIWGGLTLGLMIGALIAVFFQPEFDIMVLLKKALYDSK